MPKTFSHTVRVYWSDVDPAGVIYFPHYFRYFDDTEAEFFRSLSGKSREQLLTEAKIWLPRVEVHCRYLKLVRVDDELRIALAISEVRDKSITFKFETFRGKVKTCEATYTVVTIDNRTFKACAIPKRFRKLLAPYAP